MNAKSVLLLNLAILLANFGVAVTTSDAQTRVLRTTARVAYSSPAPPVPVASPAVRAEAADARLVKYLAKLNDLERLTAAQLAAVCRCVDWSAAVFARAARRLRAERGTPRFETLMERVREEVDGRMAAAGVADGRLRSELVRIVLSSTG